MIEMVFSGMFDRFPDLEVVFAEVDCGWVPYVKEQIDNNFHRLDPVSQFGLPRLPSEYIARPLPLRLHHRHVRDPEPRTTSGPSGSCGRATTRTSAPTGRTRGGPSRRRSPGWRRRTERELSCTATQSASTASVPDDAEHPRCFVISITPFTADGTIDEMGFRRHLGRMADAGIGVYVGGGGSGEGYTLAPGEVERLQEIAVEELKGKVPVRAMGVEPRTAGEMVAFTAGAAAAGVDAVQVYSLDVGHGHQPSPAELEAYYAEVLSTTDIPCILSTHQSVGYQVPVTLLSSLAERFGHVVGVNCSHQDLRYLAALVNALDALDGGVEVYVGGPMQALTAFALGARGFLSSEANLAPNLCAAVGRAYDSGDTDDMMRTFGTLLRLSFLLYGSGGIRITKAVLDRLGLPGGSPRPPRLPAGEEATAAALKAISELGVHAWEGWGKDL